MEPYLREHEPIFSLVLFDIRVQVEEFFFISRNKNCPLCHRRLLKFHAELPVIENIFFTKTFFLFNHSSNLVKTLHETEQKEGNNRTTE